jgi:hypothetical protein
MSPLSVALVLQIGTLLLVLYSWTRGGRGARGHRLLPSPSPLFPSITATSANPQWMSTVQPSWRTRPHLPVTARSTPRSPEDAAMTAVDATLGQTSTDHLPTSHLAIELPCTPTTNSTRCRHLRPTIHRAPTMPLWHDRAAQRTQSMQHVPVHTRPL